MAFRVCTSRLYQLATVNVPINIRSACWNIFSFFLAKHYNSLRAVSHQSACSLLKAPADIMSLARCRRGTCRARARRR